MANDNKIQLDLEISNGSIDSAFKLVDERGLKSAKDSAIAFETEFQRSEQVLKTTIEKLTNESKDYVRKSAQESAVIFQEAFTKQNNIYKASVKQNLDNALGALTNPNGLKKSAAESASVFEAAFAKEAEQFKGIDVPVNASGSALAVNGLADLNAGIQIVKLGYQTLKKVAGEAFDIVLEGDKLTRIESRFAALATQVGIVSDVFKDRLVESVKGFVDDTRLLESASAAFIKLGKNAEQLPRAFEVARKTYQVFGGDIVENANKIIDAAETGNKKSLRSIGLYIDLEGAIKIYAKKLGTIPSLLTESQKEQARLNAILAEGETRFAGVVPKAGTLSSFAQFKVALNDLNDEFSKLANSKLGGVFQTLADYAKVVVNSVSEGIKRIRPADSLDDINLRLKILKDKAEAYQKQLSDLGALGAQTALGANLKGQLITIKDQISSYDELRRKINQNLAAQNGGKKPASDADAGVEEARLRAREAANSKFNELNKSLAQSEAQLAQDEYARNQNRASLETVFYNQKLAATLQYETQKQDLENFFRDNGTVTDTQRKAARENAELQHVNTLLGIQGKYKQDLKALTNEGSIDIQNFGDVFTNVFDGMTNAVKFQSVSIKASLKDLGKAFVTTFKQQATNAIFAFAQGSKNAEEAAQGLFTGILNAMGEMLISQGLGFILQGIAFSYAGLPNGALLVSAGAGMLAFGAALAAVSAANGGKSGASSASAGGGSAGGGAYGGNNNDNSNTPIVDTKPENPNTTINVNIPAVFDRKETGLWITEVLTDNFEQNGVVVRSNV